MQVMLKNVEIVEQMLNLAKDFTIKLLVLQKY